MLTIRRDLLLESGFGFNPTDAQLISRYLKRKNLGLKIDSEVIPEVDIYKYEPWDLPEKCPIPTQDSKWHFFTSPGRKYPNGSPSNRATIAGYWKSTGKDGTIRLRNRFIGTKKSLVFHEGRPTCEMQWNLIVSMHPPRVKEIDTCPKLPNDVHTPVVIAEPSSLPRDNEEDVEQWIRELTADLYLILKSWFCTQTYNLLIEASTASQYDT